MDRQGTKTPGEREDEETERLVRPTPKVKPSRHDRKREQVDATPDPDLSSEKDKDLSLNYKDLAASVAARWVEAGAAKRIKVETRDGEVTSVTEKTLKEQPGEYKVLDGEEAANDNQPAPKKRPNLRLVKPAPEGQESQEEAQKPAPPETKKPADQEEQDTPAQTPEGSPDKAPEEKKPEKAPKAPAKPKIKTPAQEAGIKPPARPKKLTEAEKATVNEALANNFPPGVAKTLQKANMHPQDAWELVQAYQTAKRGMKDPVGAAIKASQDFTVDPKMVKVPDSLPPEGREEAYRKHQMAVVGQNLATELALRESLQAGSNKLPKLAPQVADKLVRAILTKPKEGAEDTGPAERSSWFNQMAGSSEFQALSPKDAEKLIKAFPADKAPEAAKWASAISQASAYRSLKRELLENPTSPNFITNTSSPGAIVNSLWDVNRKFKATSGEGEDLGGSSRLQSLFLRQLAQEDPKKHAKVTEALAKHYENQWAVESSQYDKKLKAWEKGGKSSEAPIAPRPNPLLWGRPGIKFPTPPSVPEPAPEAKKPRAPKKAPKGEPAGQEPANALPNPEGGQAPKPKREPKAPAGDQQAPESTDQPKTPKKRKPKAPAQPEAMEEAEPKKPKDKAPANKGKSKGKGIDWLKGLFKTKKSPDLLGNVLKRFLKKSSDLSEDSTYQTWNMMARTAQYHGVGPTPKGGDPVYTGKPRGFAQDLQESDYRDLLEQAVVWLGKPVLAEGAEVESWDDIKYRAALDLAIYESPFQGQVNAPTYNWLLSRLQGREDPCYPGGPVKDPGTPVLDSKVKGTGTGPIVRAAQARFAGEKSMNKQASDQVSKILGGLDKMAGYVKEEGTKLGFDAKTAHEIATILDGAADRLEKLAFGAESFKTRQLEVFKAAAVIQRDSDESYMDTFKNPMAPVQVEADEPYMNAYQDDQSSGVGEGESETGRPLAPTY
jgi:hypothetical protein